MTWADFYLFCFAFGFLFSVLSVIIGHLNIDFGHGHADLGTAGAHAGTVDLGDASGHVDTSTHEPHHHGSSPLNLGTISAFLAWFGGTGYLMTRFYRVWFITTLGMAVLAGVAGGWLVYLFLSRVLMRSREELDTADYQMVGVLGTVSGSIRAGGIGEIFFKQGGGHRACPARSEDGKAIANGTEVVVMRYDGGIAYVRRWDDFARDPDLLTSG